MSVIYFEYFKTPFGELKIGSYNEQLCLCDWNYRKMRSRIDERISKALNAPLEPGKSAVIEECKLQLDNFMSKQKTDFDLPLLMPGTDFQQRVWRQLMEIPYGKTMSYLELSKLLGDEKAIRAVASANGANALALIVPCHRVIGSDGELTGYAGGLSTKKKLLDLENVMRASQLELF